MSGLHARSLALALTAVLAVGRAHAQHEQGAGAGAAAPAAEVARAPIRLDAAERQAIGLTYGQVERRAVSRTIRTVGRFDFDERKLAEVTLRVGGYVQELFADTTGQAVRRGDRLLSIYSPDLFTAEQEYVLALETEHRLRESRVPGARQSSTSLLGAARRRLALWGMSEQQIKGLEESGRPALDQTIVSPISGTVIEKAVLRGQAVQPGMTLYKIADLSTIWVYADVYEYELPLVRVGQEARITTAYRPDRAFTAHVAFIYPAIDPKTRTARVRFELANGDERPLLPEMYGNVEITVPLGERLVVPQAAVIDSGRRQVVFVDGGDGRLLPRDVRLGQRFDDVAEVLGGVEAGERVVTSANFLVDSESRLEAAESMIGMMSALGMGGVKMETARPMEMGGEPGPPASAGPPAGEEKRVDDLQVAVFPGRAPASVGENAIRIRIRDGAGRPLTGAGVTFTYTMDMPGMTIERAATRELGDGLYEGAARFTMGGPWSVVVQIERPGTPPARGRFTVRASG